MAHAGSRDAQAGFTLAELVVALLVTVMVIIAVLGLFDFTSKIASVQSNVSDMQESLRTAQAEIEHLVRMAGRGGMPMSTALPQGNAVWTVDNVAAGTRIAGAGTPEVLAGSDILIVRGIFSTVYQVNSQGVGVFTLRDAGGNPTANPAQAFTGTLVIGAASTTGIPQSLSTLDKAVSDGVHEALVLRSASNRDVYAVVELLPETSNVDLANQARLDFRIRGSATADSFRALSSGGDFPATLQKVGYAGILDEHRYYVRRTVAGTEVAPVLTRARVLPNTQTAYGPLGNPANSENLSIDLADNILDLQVALALDTTNHIPRPLPVGAPPEPAGLTTIDANPANGYISEANDGVNDDWLYNSTTDSPAQPVWAGARLCYVRLNLLARTDRRDTAYEAPALARIEDRTYAVNDPLNVARTAGGTDRMFRRRILQTTINVRNL
jgi:type II secretory pathway pseudopilin PulG